MWLSRIIAMLAACLLVAAPATACLGPFSERYLIWYEQPRLLPGEVAIELDVEDLISTYKSRDLRLPRYKMQPPFAAVLHEATIEVRRESDTCEREFASGSARKMFLVGVLTRNQRGSFQLLPRYMSYRDPIRERASQALTETTDGN